jgi:Family of unknown function (DUF6755)
VETRRQGLPLFTGICFLIGVLVIIQLWLLAAALEAARSAMPHVLWPATLASLALFLLNAGLLKYVVDFDRRLRRQEADRDA